MTMKNLSLKTVLPWVVVFILLIFLIANYMKNVPDSMGFNNFLALLREPIVIAIITVVIGFLIFDRWKRLETEISDITKNRDEALKDVREELREGINTRVDSLMQK